MKQIHALIFAALTVLFIGQASAATATFSGPSLNSLSSPLICAESTDKDSTKTKEKKEDEEEPECD